MGHLARHCIDTRGIPLICSVNLILAHAHGRVKGCGVATMDAARDRLGQCEEIRRLGRVSRVVVDSLSGEH